MASKFNGIMKRYDELKLNNSGSGCDWNFVYSYNKANNRFSGVILKRDSNMNFLHNNVFHIP